MDDEIRATEDEIRYAVHTDHWRKMPESAYTHDHKGRLQCRASVHDEGRSVTFHQCRRRGVIEEGGYWWCKAHHPTSVKRKRAADSAAWERERAAEKEREQKREAIRDAERAVIDLARKCARQEGTFDDLMDAVARLDALTPTT